MVETQEPNPEPGRPNRRGLEERRVRGGADAYNLQTEDSVEQPERRTREGGNEEVD